jgi:hypothetical protein
MHGWVNAMIVLIPITIDPRIVEGFATNKSVFHKIHLAYKLTLFLQRRRNGRKGYTSIRLDISKTYDRVE